MLGIHINTSVTNPLILQYDMVEHVEGEEFVKIFFSFNKMKWFKKKFFQKDSTPYIKYSGLSILGFNILSVKTRHLKMAMG